MYVCQYVCVSVCMCVLEREGSRVFANSSIDSHVFGQLQ